MIKNSIIVIPCNVPWEWTTDYINQTANILRKTNTVICFFWLDAHSIKEHVIKRKNYPLFFQRLESGVIGYYAVHFLPFRRFSYIFRLNLYIIVFIVKLYCQILSKRQFFRKRILWFFDPISYPVIKLFSSSWFWVYDCIDYSRGNIFLSKMQKKKLIDHENEIIRISNVVTVNSSVLYKIHAPFRKDIHIVPQGFRLDEFMRDSPSSIRFPKDNPIIGYIGALNYRLDYQLLVKVAKRLPKCQFVLVGPIQNEHISLGKRWLTYARDHLFSLQNVKVIFGAGKREVKNIIIQFDIGMIPYVGSTDFNKYCYPMKLFEYFYTGKPVISIPIEELKQFPKFVKIGKTAKEWERHIRLLLAKPWAKKYQKEQRKLAISNSWERKIYQILELIH